MKKRIHIVALCMFITAPAMADLFGIGTSNPETTFTRTGTTGTFTATDFANTMVTVFRNTPPLGSAYLLPGLWAGTQDVDLTMTISNIGSYQAEGSGDFTFTDIDGDTITGLISGQWKRDGLAKPGKFFGTLTNVNYNPVTDNQFDGNYGSTVSMDFGTAEPWNGFVTGIVAGNAWFGDDFSVAGGSIDMRVVPVPVALLIGLLGLGTAGIKLRKYV